MLDETQMGITCPMAGDSKPWPIILLYRSIVGFWITYCEIPDTHCFHSPAIRLYRAPVRATVVVLVHIGAWVDCLLLHIVEDSSVCEQGFSYPGLWVLTLLKGRIGFLKLRFFCL